MNSIMASTWGYASATDNKHDNNKVKFSTRYYFFLKINISHLAERLEQREEYDVMRSPI